MVQSENARENARDIAIDRGRLPVEGDRGDRRRRVVADARQKAELGLLVGKTPAAPRDLLRAGVQIARPGIIAEPGENADHRLRRGGRQTLDSRPLLDEVLEIRRRGLGRGLLKQHFRQPDTVGIGRFPRPRAPRKLTAVAIPPSERMFDDRVSLCLEPGRAYSDVHPTNPTPDSATMKLQRRGAKALAEFMPGIIEEALAARGLSEASLIADWPAIVGASVARYARPIQLQWRPRPMRRDPEAPIAPATLVLRVEGAFALEAQHNAAVIAARVNAHLGWRCVEKIAFRQGPLPPLREKPRPPPSPSAEAEAEARTAAATIENDDLREVLTRLGARAIDRSARRFAGETPRKGD